MADQVLLKIVCLLMRWLFGLAVVAARGEGEKDAELLVLRHENAVLRRNADRTRYESGDRVWFAALTRFIPSRRWAEIVPVTPATLLAWNRRARCQEIRHQQAAPPGRPATVQSIARLTIRLAKFTGVRVAAQTACTYSGELGWTVVNCNPNCSPKSWDHPASASKLDDSTVGTMP